MSQPERRVEEEDKPLMALLIQIKVKCLWEVEGALRPVTPMGLAPDTGPVCSDENPFTARQQMSHRGDKLQRDYNPLL